MNRNYSQLDALLIGYENQENIGLRSILAYLSAHGYKAALVPFFPGRHADVLEATRKFCPRLVGFSLIFQYTLDEFGQLIHYLRDNGVRAHFTSGGHFPSLRPEETLELLPGLDSIVRFEGELTLTELLDRLNQPNCWGSIQSLAFRDGTKVVLTPPRPLIEDLDSLPPIYRDEPRLAGNEVGMASILASRGCLFNCSFCSIRQFYGSVPGALRRTRSPEAVVDEMRMLFTENGIRLFIFQDDDFAARTPRQRKWLQAFLAALTKTGLANKVKWKISCRVDDLEPEILKTMLNHGLIAVYLGVESGSGLGLKTLNKHVSVEQNLAAIDLLKRHNVALAIGFMLFDPSSTVDTIRENLDFLKKVGEDGYFPINFCKLLPYAGTPIEAKLRSEGRLKGTPSQPDYDFIEPRLDWYAFLVQRIFSRRNFTSNGIVARLQRIDFDYHLIRSLNQEAYPKDCQSTLRQIITKSNMRTLKTLNMLLDTILHNDIDMLIDEEKTLLEFAEQEWRCEAEIEADLIKLQEMAKNMKN
jgi:radical SAM superfamily enzyme YgiQ (UPF0313 family)